MKIKVVWFVEPFGGATVVGNQIADMEIDFRDSIVVSTNIVPHGGMLNIYCRIYLEDPERINKVSKDHWFSSGHNVMFFREDPRDQNKLCPEGEYARIRKSLRDDLFGKLEDVAAGNCPGSEMAIAIIDSELPELASATRCELAVVADFLSSQTNTSVEMAAFFVCDHSRVWGNPSDPEEVQKGAMKVVDQAKNRLLPSFYRPWMQRR